MEGTLSHLVDTLFPLPDEDLRDIYRLCAESVESARNRGLASVADWFDALGALLSLELDRRAGSIDVSTLTNPGPGALLLARGQAMTTEELRTIGRSLYVALFGLPRCPRGDFVHAALGILHTEGTRREALR